MGSRPAHLPQTGSGILHRWGVCRRDDVHHGIRTGPETWLLRLPARSRLLHGLRRRRRIRLDPAADHLRCLDGGIRLAYSIPGGPAPGRRGHLLPNAYRGHSGIPPGPGVRCTGGPGETQQGRGRFGQGLLARAHHRLRARLGSQHPRLRRDLLHADLSHDHAALRRCARQPAHPAGARPALPVHSTVGPAVRPRRTPSRAVLRIGIGRRPGTACIPAARQGKCRDDHARCAAAGHPGLALRVEPGILVAGIVPHLVALRWHGTVVQPGRGPVRRHRSVHHGGAGLGDG